MRPVTRTAIAVASMAGALVVSGCASPADANGDGVLRIVTSTNVYGDIAEQIGGELVEVTSIIDSPAQDPHSFEAGARVQLALALADIVIENGGGYDDFVDTLLDGAGNDGVELIDVADLYGHDGEFNEHLWYDLPTVQRLADELVGALSSDDPENADAYARNAAAFTDGIRALASREAELKVLHEGTGAAITEPVPGYLLAASGLVDRTPPEFSEAIEEGTDVAPAVLQETLALFGTGSVRVLFFNEQTTSPETELVLDAAERYGVPVVPVGETLPEGAGYLEWIAATLDAVEDALAGS